MSEGGCRETKRETGGGTGAPPENHWMPDFHLLLDPENFSTLEPRASSAGCANAALIEDSLACSM
jgi:hypothetical protein